MTNVINIPETISILTEKEKILLISGFFDGEGCIGIAKNGSISTSTVNTCKTNIEFIQSIFPDTMSLRSTIVNKPQYMHRLYGINAYNFLNTIKDYLIEKRSQAYTTIEYFDLREEIPDIFIPGQRGRHKNPDRVLLIETFRDILKEQKEEWH